MTPVYVYPASFCPPTYGHMHTLLKAAAIFPKVTLVCSVNPDKTNNWFTPKESQAMWESYGLPSNVTVETFGSMMIKNPDTSNLVMIRGIRDDGDAVYEKKIMFYNNERFGISTFTYFMSDGKHREISSSKARAKAENLELEELSALVSPLVISNLLEKVLGINNLYMVVGRPGAGKSSFMKMLSAENPNNVHIETDKFSQATKPLLKEAFGNDDLVTLALTRDEELTKVIKRPWMNYLREALRAAPEESNVFLEIPYGLRKGKDMFQYVGGKILYVGCERAETNEERINESGRSELSPFVAMIPDKNESEKIVENNRLNLTVIENDGSIESLKKKAMRYNCWLQQGEEKWKTYSPGLCLAI